MACPNQGAINSSLTFTIRTFDSEDVPTWADSEPTYTVYKGETLVGNIVHSLQDIEMTAVSDTIGLYSSEIDLSETYFELYQAYIIVVEYTVGGNDGSRTYSFVVAEEDDINDTVPEQDNISASADFSGTFRQGNTAILKLRIMTLDGMPIDPSVITCTISGPTENESTNAEVISGTPYQVERGFYVYEWIIDQLQEMGTYVVDWSYIINSIEKHEYQNVAVTNGSSDITILYTERMIAFREALTYHISCAQSIPVYFEQSKPSYDLKTFEFSFKNWNQSAGVRVYRNQNLLSSGVAIDYSKGKIVFSSILRSQETINVDYNFRWFTDSELDRFLFNAVQTVNIYPPHSSYTLEDMPDKYIPVILYGAAKDALRQLLLCLQFQQPQQVFGGREAAQQAFTNMESLKKNYESDWEKLLEQKKYGPYPQTRVTSTPEYTLPGGRSRWFRYLFKS